MAAFSSRRLLDSAWRFRCSCRPPRWCAAPTGRTGADRRGPGRLDRNGPGECVVPSRCRTSRGGCPTAGAPARSYSATACTCRTRPAAGETEQERLMCFNADTGKLLWEHRYNMFTSDVPPHRIAWSSPVVDPATGNVFAISGNGLAMSLNKDGKLLWERSLAEEYGMWTTHGGRMSTPIIDGDRMIVSGLVFGWGQTASPAHRFIALDKSQRPDDLGERAGGPAHRHDLRQPVRRGRQRRADVLLGRERRRDARAEDLRPASRCGTGMSASVASTRPR